MPTRLIAQHTPARQLSVETVRTLWRLRLDYFPLGPERSAEEDWFEFSAYFQRERRDAVVFRHAGEIVGFFVNSHDRIVIEGRAALLVSLEYVYLRPRFRGHPSFILSGFRMFLALRMRHPRAPIYYVGFMFPNSYAVIDGTFGRTLTLQDATPPAPFERAILEWYGREAGGKRWDPVRQVAVYKNRPPAIVDRDEKPAKVQAAYDRYERLNPTWQDGDCIVVVAPADGAAFRSALARAMTRATRRSRRDVRTLRTQDDLRDAGQAAASRAPA